MSLVGGDRTEASQKDGTYGRVKLTIQPVWSFAQLDPTLQKLVGAKHWGKDAEELFLTENTPTIRVLKDQLIQPKQNVLIDYDFKTGMASRWHGKSQA